MTTLFIIALEFMVFAVLLSIIVVAMGWKLAPQDMFFTKVETGDMKYVVAGDSWIRTIVNIPTMRLNEDEPQKLEPLGGSKTEQTWLERKFGLYWVGIYPFRKIHKFSIVKERENPEMKQGMNPAEWIQREKKATQVTSLRWKFPRPVMVPDVEFDGNLRATLLVLCKFEVVSPTVPIFIQKANFFDLLSSYVRSAVIEYCQTKTYDKFRKSDKKDGGEMSTAIINDINRIIVDEIGVCLKGVSVSNYEASDKETQAILEAGEKARLQGEANVKAAELQKKVAITNAQGQAEADQIRAVARITDVIETVQRLSDRGVNPDVAAQVAGSVGRAERFTREGSKITTLVDGGTGNVSIPLPGEKK
jgi:hypothetical protein